MTTPGLRANYVMTIGCLLCGIVCLLAAWNTWPPIDGDGPAYFPAAVEWSLGRSLTNPLWLPPLTDTIDGPGGRRYTYHGFLYAIVVGTAARPLGGGAAATVVSAFVVHWIAACLAAAAILSWTAVQGLTRLVLAGLLPLSMLGLSIAWHGRVEPLAILVVGATCLGWRRLDGDARALAAGVGTGLLFFTSPACGALGVCVLAAAVVASRRDGSCGRMVVAAVAGWCVSAALAIWVYPYPILDWIEGLRRHAQINLSIPRGQGFEATWLTRPELPLLAASLGLLVIGALVRLRELGGSLETTRRAVLVVALTVFTTGLTRIALMKTEASYNAVVFMPLLACVGFSQSRSPWRTWALIGALALPAAGMLRSSVLMLRQFDSGTATFRDARDRIRQATPFGCAITPALWMAADDVTKVAITGTDTPRSRFFIRQQVNTGQVIPPDYAGYTLIENRYGPGVSVLGWPISRTPGGWGFAVYESRK